MSFCRLSYFSMFLSISASLCLACHFQFPAVEGAGTICLLEGMLCLSHSNLLTEAEKQGSIVLV